MVVGIFEKYDTGPDTRINDMPTAIYPDRWQYKCNLSKMNIYLLGKDRDRDII